MILIIDDNEDDFLMAKRTLKEQGYDVSYASSGKDGIALVKKNPPDLILVDRNMPEMNGLKVCNYLKSDEEVCHIPVILWTSDDSKQNIIDGINAGADDFVTKSSDLDLLLVRIKAMVRIKKLHETVQELSITDELTELFNRRHLYRELKKEFQRVKRYNCDLSIIIIDIDHFKQINDKYGHQYGDFVLKELASILRESNRTTDIIFRYGGEEFLIMLPHTTSENAFTVAERLRTVIKDHGFCYNEISTRLTISIGICSCPNDNINTEDDIIKIADLMLYKAKEAGRDRIISFAEFMLK